MKKIIAIIMVLVLMACCLCSCTVEENIVQGNNTNKITLSPSLIIHIWTDEETGVQYLVYDGHKQGGICPRLNADGSLYTTQPTEKGGDE